jgi:UDP-glucose 6-dehydrogenase
MKQRWFISVNTPTKNVYGEGWMASDLKYVELCTTNCLCKSSDKIVVEKSTLPVLNSRNY